MGSEPPRCPECGSELLGLGKHCHRCREYVEDMHTDDPGEHDQPREEEEPDE